MSDPFYQIAGYPFLLHISPSTAHDFNSGLKRVLFGFRHGYASAAGVPEQQPYSEGTPYGVLRCYPAEPFARVEVALDAGCETLDPVELVDTFEPLIVNHAIREAPLHLWIHGACLVRGDDVILLVAETGTGKTTLSMGLLAQGYRLLTDDIILINLHTRQIVPVPRCPKYRETAPERLLSVGFDLGRDAETLGHYVLLPDEYLYTQPLPGPVRRVYCLQRKPHLPPGAQPLSFTDGLLALLPHSNLLAIDPVFTLATEIFGTTRFINLNLSHYPTDLTHIAAGR